MEGKRLKDDTKECYGDRFVSIALGWKNLLIMINTT